MNADAILKRLEGRQSRWGIGRAARYLEAMEPYAEDAKAFAEVLKRAEGKLVYTDPDCLVDEKAIGGKRLKAADDPTPGAVMTFKATITTTRRDRDGDVLESEGARPDMLGPLLWNHNTMEPIGKPLSAAEHSQKRYVEELAIINSPLGRDIAQLVDFGALRRMSHGFLIDEDEDAVEEMADKEGRFLGWHIRVFEIIERSIVSVASNTDAIITAYSRDKLCTPMVKGWAGRLFDERPVIVRGATISRTPLSPELAEELEKNKGESTPEDVRVAMGDPDAELPEGTLWTTSGDGPDLQPTSSSGCSVKGTIQLPVLECARCGRKIMPGPGDFPEIQRPSVCRTCDPEGHAEFLRKFSQAAEVKGTVPGDPSGGSGEGQEGEWSKPNLSDFTDKMWDDCSMMERRKIAKHYAWYSDLDSFGSLKLPHHFPASGKPSLNGVRNALARANQVDGIGGDLEKVRAHLQAHMPKSVCLQCGSAMAMDQKNQYWCAVCAESLERTGSPAGYEAAVVAGIPEGYRCLPSKFITDTASSAGQTKIVFKSGRTLSKANETRLRDARGDIGAILDKESTREIKALARSAAANLDTVLEAVAGDDEGKQATATGKGKAGLVRALQTLGKRMVRGR